MLVRLTKNIRRYVRVALTGENLMIFAPTFLAIVAQAGDFARRPIADVLASIPPSVKAGGWTTPKALHKWIRKNYNACGRLASIVEALL